jgi:hypothetical protein
MILDRQKESLAAFVRAQFPEDLYVREWPGVVVSQGGANAFDFQPDDSRVPGMSGIPLALPFPGFALTINPGDTPRARVGFRGGNPATPELRLWDSPGLSTLNVTAEQSITAAAPSVNLGNPATDPLIKGEQFLTVATTPFVQATVAFQTALAQFLQALNTYAQGIQANADPSNTATPDLQSAIGTFTSASAEMIAQAEAYQVEVQTSLSAVSKTA